jgi:hypothetical protein
MEFLTGHPDTERFEALPQDELAKIYAEGIAMNFVFARQQSQTGDSNNISPEGRD